MRLRAASARHLGPGTGLVHFGLGLPSTLSWHAAKYAGMRLAVAGRHQTLSALQSHTLQLPNARLGRSRRQRAAPLGPT